MKNFRISKYCFFNIISLKNVFWGVFYKPEPDRFYTPGFGSGLLIGYPGFRVSGYPGCTPYFKWAIHQNEK